MDNQGRDLIVLEMGLPFGIALYEDLLHACNGERVELGSFNAAFAFRRRDTFDTPPLIGTGRHKERDCLPRLVAASQPEISSLRKQPRH